MLIVGMSPVELWTGRRHRPGTGLGRCAGSFGHEARDNAGNCLIAAGRVHVCCLQSGLEQSAKARDVLAGVEGRGSCQPGLLHILGIKLSETSTDRLAGG